LGAKILLFIGGVHGSKNEGIDILEKVANEGNYSRDQAKVMLIVIYNREKKLDESLKLLEGLSSQYPRNTLFPLEKGMVLAEMSRFRDSIQVFEEMLKNPLAMDYMPDLVHFEYAQALSDARSWEKAYEHFLETARSSKAPETLVTIS